MIDHAQELCKSSAKINTEQDSQNQTPNNLTGLNF